MVFFCLVGTDRVFLTFVRHRVKNGGRKFAMKIADMCTINNIGIKRDSREERLVNEMPMLKNFISLTLSAYILYI